MATLQKYLVGLNIDGDTFLLATTPSGHTAFFSDIEKLKKSVEEGYCLAVLDKPEDIQYIRDWSRFIEMKINGKAKRYKSRFFPLKIHSKNNPFKILLDESKKFQSINKIQSIKLDLKVYRYSVKTIPDAA